MFKFSHQYCIFDSILKCSLQEKISKDTEVLNNSINQLDLVDICIILHPTTAEYTFFSSTHRTFTKIDHLLGHREDLIKFKRIQIIQSMFSDQNGIKLEICNREISGKF